ncbi:hypothetical protein WA026_022867 [Henosepilachna vigintioctopunctata]|uniref:Uncharacterized protein n=1 Tax=Henosepilachna vigintioctopunctata TaxID=420089 RepID=A0AAW1U4H4_9CUCU
MKHPAEPLNSSQIHLRSRQFTINIFINIFEEGKLNHKLKELNSVRSKLFEELNMLNPKPIIYTNVEDSCLTLTNEEEICDRAMKLKHKRNDGFDEISSETLKATIDFTIIS